MLFKNEGGNLKAVSRAEFGKRIEFKIGLLITRPIFFIDNERFR